MQHSKGTYANQIKGANSVSDNGYNARLITVTKSELARELEKWIDSTEGLVCISIPKITEPSSRSACLAAKNPNLHILVVGSGDSALPSLVARRVMRAFAGLHPPTKCAAVEEFRLTKREKNVLQRMVEGQVRKQIADGLGLKNHTLDYVIRCTYRKLGVNNITAAVSVAIRKGLVENVPSLTLED